MAQHFEFPILWMQDYIKVHQWKHPMTPYTEEQLEEMTEEELVIDFLEMKRTQALKGQKGHTTRPCLRMLTNGAISMKHSMKSSGMP